MNLPQKYLTWIILLFFPLFLQGQKIVPEKVLFIGNSYTYFWNLPQAVALMAEERGIELETRQSTSGGSNWGHHWRGERDLQSLEKIKSGQFDAVVLQNHSLSALNRADSLMHFGQLLDSLIKGNNAKTYLYLTWARAYDPSMQKGISKQYEELAKATGAVLVPVGPAWQHARKLNPEFPLYDDDESHPSTLGTYLSACVFFGAFTGESPVGLPNRLITTDADGEKLYISIQSEKKAAFCQQVAADILQEYKLLSPKK
jgi:hypothetical protein